MATSHQEGQKPAIAVNSYAEAADRMYGNFRVRPTIYDSSDLSRDTDPSVSAEPMVPAPEPEVERGRVMIGTRELSPFFKVTLYGGMLATAVALAAGKGPEMARGVMVATDVIGAKAHDIQGFFKGTNPHKPQFTINHGTHGGN